MWWSRFRHQTKFVADSKEQQCALIMNGQNFSWDGQSAWKICHFKGSATYKAWCLSLGDWFYFHINSTIKLHTEYVNTLYSLSHWSQPLTGMGPVGQATLFRGPSLAKLSMQENVILELPLSLSYLRSNYTLCNFSYSYTLSSIFHYISFCTLYGFLEIIHIQPNLKVVGLTEFCSSCHCPSACLLPLPGALCVQNPSLFDRLTVLMNILTHIIATAQSPRWW